MTEKEKKFIDATCDLGTFQELLDLMTQNGISYADLINRGGMAKEDLSAIQCIFKKHMDSKEKWMAFSKNHDSYYRIIILPVTSAFMDIYGKK